MNGRTAKRLMKAAQLILQEQGIDWGEGYNQYNQLDNCISWEPAYEDGHIHDWENPENNAGHKRRTDPDGNPLIGPLRKPGTIFTAWKLRVVYQNLKRLWKKTNGRHEIFSTYVR